MTAARVDKTWVIVLLLVLLCAGCGSGGIAAPVARDRLADHQMGSGLAVASLVIEPNAGFRPLTRLINHAQDHVFLEAYILTDSRIVHALERARAEGVKVFVMLERGALGMGTQPQRMADMLTAAGIAVRWTRPGFRLTHAKFMVIDDRLLILGTGNFSRSAFLRDRDFFLFVRSRAEVTMASSLFRADWDRMPATVQDANLLVSPDNSRYKLASLVGSARTTIDVYDEEIADVGLERLLTRRVGNGVRVRAILPSGASPAAVRVLARGGVMVRELQAPYVHAKMILVDGLVAYVGSENLSTASLDLNRELGALLRGSRVRQLERVFSTDWGRAQAVPLSAQPASRRLGLRR